MVAPGQSAYNPVERSIATLSKKVTRITLPIDHLELTNELGLHNFEYGANLWRKDRIFGKPILAEYIDRSKTPFADIS